TQADRLKLRQHFFNLQATQDFLQGSDEYGFRLSRHAGGNQQVDAQCIGGFVFLDRLHGNQESRFVPIDLPQQLLPVDTVGLVVGKLKGFDGRKIFHQCRRIGIHRFVVDQNVELCAAERGKILLHGQGHDDDENHRHGKHEQQAMEITGKQQKFLVKDGNESDHDGSLFSEFMSGDREVNVFQAVHAILNLAWLKIGRPDSLQHMIDARLHRIEIDFQAPLFSLALAKIGELFQLCGTGRFTQAQVKYGLLLVEQVRQPALQHDPSVIDDGQLIADRLHFLHVMGGVDDGHAACLQLPNRFQNEIARLDRKST